MLGIPCVYNRKGPSINFLGPEKRLFSGGSPAGYPARKVYVYVVVSPLIFTCLVLRAIQRINNHAANRVVIVRATGGLFNKSKQGLKAVKSNLVLRA